MHPEPPVRGSTHPPSPGWAWGKLPPFPAGSVAWLGAGKAWHRGRGTGRIAAAEGICYCNAGRRVLRSAAGHRASAFCAAPGAGEVGSGVARASGVLPWGTEYLGASAPRARSFSPVSRGSPQIRQTPRGNRRALAERGCRFAPGAGAISVPAGWLQFAPASRGGRQSCRSVPSVVIIIIIAPASLPHPGMRARLAAASPLRCPSCSLAPRMTYTTASPPWQGFILRFEPPVLLSGDPHPLAALLGAFKT